MTKTKEWLIRHKRVLLRCIWTLLAGLLLVQILYPGDRLPLFSAIDGQNVSAWKKQDAAWQLDKLANDQPVQIKLGNSSANYDSATPAELGTRISNNKRIEDSGYPWLLRLVPTSLFWYGPLQADSAPEYKTDEKKAKQYLNDKLGKSCNIPPKNASLEYKDEKLSLISAKDGGTCKESEAIEALGKVKPRLNQASSVTIPVDQTKPAVSDEEARDVQEKLTKTSREGVKLEVNGKPKTITQKEVLSWLSFKPVDGKLDFTIDPAKANIYLAKNVTPSVSKPAGITKITTLDFTEVLKSVGATGRTLALATTLTDITKVLDGTQATAKASTANLPPKVTYIRSYTKTSVGISALMTHYDQDHPGVFGVSFQELGGRGLSADYNSSQRFTTASTYKLFVAYGTLRKVDAGTWKWSNANIASGRNLSTCFDDMIVKSDNACAEALLTKLGLSKLTKDIKAIGLNNSGFTLANTPVTTASDLTLFLTKLQSNQLPIKSDSRGKFIEALKRNVYRQGIPSGASGQTANKVGFLNALLHDAGIVYSSKGTYALTVLTEGSSWTNIAELTRKIEALR